MIRLEFHGNATLAAPLLHGAGFRHLLDATITHLEALKAEGRCILLNESVQILREMLQERRERAEPAQSNGPFAQKPIARETVSRKESSVVTDAGKAQAADLVGRVADGRC